MLVEQAIEHLADMARKPTCCAPSPASRSSGPVMTNAHRRLSRHVRPDHARPSRHHPARRAAGRPAGDRGHHQPVQGADVLGRRAAGDGAREVADLPGDIEVVEFDSLLMDFAEAQGASLILRGLRAVADFEYEYQMAGMNQQLNDRDRDGLPDGRRVAAADRVKAGERNRALWRRSTSSSRRRGRRRRRRLARG
jgi:hypothetical protein